MIVDGYLKFLPSSLTRPQHEKFWIVKDICRIFILHDPKKVDVSPNDNGQFFNAVCRFEVEKDARAIQSKVRMLRRILKG